MYSVNGEFGEVRMSSYLQGKERNELFSLEIAGWHKCNDLYQIRYSRGRERHLLLFTVDGVGDMLVDGRKYELSSDTVALIPRYTLGGYGTRQGKQWEFYWIHPSGAVADNFLDAVASEGVLVKSVGSVHGYGETIERLMYQCRQPVTNPLVISGSVSELLHSAAMDLQENTRINTLSARAIRYIEQHFNETVLVEDIAKALFCSPAHLSRVFRKETGCTLHRYIINHRLRMAMQLLKFSDLRVWDVAAAVGFSSASHFIELFKRQYGCSPNKYLKK